MVDVHSAPLSLGEEKKKKEERRKINRNHRAKI